MFAPSRPDLFSGHYVDGDIRKPSILNEEITIDYRGIFAFVLVLCIASALVLFVLVPDMAKSKKAAVHAQQTAAAPAAYVSPKPLKMSGKVTEVLDKLPPTSSNSSKGRIVHLIPERYITMENPRTTFRIPSYLMPFLWDDDLLKAKSVQVEYLGMERNRNYVHYYEAIALKVDGTTYLMPTMFYILDSPINWLLFFLILMPLWKFLLRELEG